MTSTDTIIVGLALLSFVSVTVATHPRTWSWPTRFARWVWGLNGCVRRWGSRGPFTKEQVEIGMHGRTYPGGSHLRHAAANAIIQGASHDMAMIEERIIAGTRHGDVLYGDVHVARRGSIGTEVQELPNQGPEEDTALGEDSDGFLIKVADRLPGAPDLEKCDAFVSTTRASRSGGGFSVSSHPAVTDMGDTVWTAAMGGGDNSGVIVFAHEDVAIIVDVITCPGLQDRVEGLARLQHSTATRTKAIEVFERDAVGWVRANLRRAAADRILGMLDLENVAVRPVTKEPIRRALDLKGDDDEQQARGGEK